MATSHPIYRSLVCLYPRTFRGHYGDDLVEHFADMVTDRGARAAWTRTALDLLVTVPRYRLESIMNEQHAGTTLNIVITLLMGGGVLTFFTGTYPGLVLVVTALAIAFAQRSTLARAIRTPDPDLRLRRLGIAGVLTLVFVVSYVTYLLLIGDHWTIRESLLTGVGTLAMLGAIAFLIAGLLTPKGPVDRPVTPIG